MDRVPVDVARGADGVGRVPVLVRQRRPVVLADGVRLDDHVVVVLLGVVGHLELQGRRGRPVRSIVRRSR